MKRTLSLAGTTLGIVILAAVSIVVILALRGQQTQPQPIAQMLQSPIETATPAAPAPNPTVAATPIPLCTFTVSATPPDPKQSIDRFSFSEPQVVLTHTAAIGIAGWLPDSQRILITRDIPGQARQYIETLDSETGKLLPYGERYGFSTKPIWLAAEQAVAFTDATPDNQIALRISHGSDKSIENIAGGLASPNVAASPDGREFIFFAKEAKERPVSIDIAQTRQEAFPFALPMMSPEELHAIGQTFGPDPYRVVLGSNRDRFALFNDTGFFLTDRAAGKICQVDLGTKDHAQMWAMEAQWSSNGRYLAILTTIGDLPIPFAGLTILDIVNSEIVQIDLGVSYIYEITWGGDNQFLVALGQIEIVEGTPLFGMYIVDTSSGGFRRILSDHIFSPGVYFYEGGGLAWSPNEKNILAKCPEWSKTEPTIIEDRLCVIDVGKRP
ncbi:MAG: hypothetical protein KF753_16725 [Caldilineaceae bacterium]|nr:hypothetical protein [Caldilineaceae bacterium]